MSEDDNNAATGEGDGSRPSAPPPGDPPATDPDASARKPRTYYVVHWKSEQELVIVGRCKNSKDGEEAIAKGKFKPEGGIFSVLCKSSDKFQLKPVTTVELARVAD